ncbi:response regulator [Marinicrinis lubricantis]|uniref:Response regulator n=1 Tax=Marinicrinis lubricantis TaxID=2086470 RepID=A0ABW1IJY9_9BACL
MKALIVDDEAHVRNAIKLLVHWEELGIEQIMEAENGAEAVPLIEKERPQIVILDMLMPYKSGVELMKWISDSGIPTKMIVISGHDDFEFVRSAVKYGGLDYLLKPIDPESVNEVLEKAVLEWRKEVQDLKNNSQAHQYKSVLTEKLLTSMITEPGSQQASLHRLREECGLPAEAGPFRLALLQAADEPSLIKRFGNSDLLYFSLHNICNEYLQMGHRGIAFRYWGAAGKIVLLLWRNTDSFPEILLNMNEGFHSTLRQRMHFGISSEGSFPSDMPGLYEEAAEALCKRNLLDPSVFIHKMPADDTDSALSLADVEERWRLAALSGSTTEIGKAVDGWMACIKKQKVITPEMLKQWRREAFEFRSKLLQETLHSKAAECLTAIEKEDLPYPGEHTDTMHYQQWHHYWHDFLQRLSDALLSHQSQKQHIIFEIAKYVEQHYHEDISLQDMSERFFVSREYISRKFKQQFDINLSEYLGQIRLKNAKKLLLNPHLTIAEIAQMVGYQDEKYFSKVFKKHETITPNQYRKKHIEES